MRPLAASSLLLVVVSLASACFSPSSSRCGDNYCPAGFICQVVASADAGVAPSGPVCVARSDNCAGQPDGTLCEGEVRSVCIAGGCHVSSCGDGVIDRDNPLEAEICDEGPANGPEENAACRADCTPGRCGDGVIDSDPHGREPEMCDQGADNTNSGPAFCRNNCQPSYCGDGITDSGESPCWGPPTLLVERTPFERTLVVDLDGDGFTDLIQPNADPNTNAVHFRYGRADGRLDFAEQVFEYMPVPVVAADVDGDGDLDLVGALAGVGIVHNLGNRQLEDAGRLDISADLLTAGDYDHDGDADLLVSDTAGLWFVRSLGPAGFDVPALISPLQARFEPVTGDVNGDGIDDVVVLANDLVALVSHGDGSFAAPEVLATNAFDLISLHVVDLDGDGDDDVITTDGSEGSLHIFESRGNAGFAPVLLAPGVSQAADLTVGDLDGIALLDVALLHIGDASDSIRLLEGFDALSYVGDPPQSIDRDLESAHLAIVDLDHDGFADIVGTGGSTWVSYGGDGPVGPPLELTRATTLHAATLGDLDGDGAADVLFSAFDQPAAGFGVPQVARSRGGRRFAPVVPIVPGVACRALTVGDFDGDTRPDAACAGPSRFSILHGLPGGGFAAAAATMFVDPAAVSLHAADLDGDGRDDLLAIFGPSGQGVHVVSFAGGADASLGAPEPFVSDAGAATDAALADLDGDGRADLLLATAGGVVWHAGRAGGGFAAARPALPAGVRVLAGDLDGDPGHHLDLVVTLADGSLRAFLGDGAGGFSATSWSDSSDGGLHTVAVLADVNGDAALDLVDGNSTSPDPFAGIRYGDGHGRFGARVHTSILDLAAVGDVTGDGRADLVSLGGTIGGPNVPQLTVAVGRFSLAP